MRKPTRHGRKRAATAANDLVWFAVTILIMNCGVGLIITSSPKAIEYFQFLLETENVKKS
jgi:hypothetical protein